MIELLNIDCMEYMAGLPDRAFPLAIADPEYGIGVGKMAFLKEIKTTVKQKNGTRLNPNKRQYKIKDWDKKPAPIEYFNELFRVSENQIIFGIDYFDWKPYCNGRIRWDKGVPDGVSFKRYETAYCSLIDEEITLPLLWAGMMQAKSLKEPMVQQGNKQLNEKRIHPCQKPVLLYKKLLSDYAKPGDKILDTHGGSMSIAIACHEMGFDLTLCEIDKDYYEAGLKRFNEAKKQQVLFNYDFKT
jgi:site-specific DNA-methyltransferase (adenine-specific)